MQVGLGGAWGLGTDPLHLPCLESWTWPWPLSSAAQDPSPGLRLGQPLGQEQLLELGLRVLGSPPPWLLLPCQVLC